MTWDVDRIVEIYSGTLIASATGSSFPVRHRESALIFVNVSAVSGTDPTLVLSVEISDDNVDWYDVAVVIDTDTEGVLTRLTAPTDEAKITKVGKYKVDIPCCLGKYMRAKAVIAGTDPSFTMSVTAVLK